MIFATGSRPVQPQWLEGKDKPHVIVAEDMLMQPELITGQRIVVIGGGLVGAEAALWMAQKGKSVTLIEAADDIIGGPHGTCFANYQMLKELLVAENVDVQTSTFLKHITDTGLVVHPAGDSQQARTIMAAIWDGYEVARSL